MYTFEKQLELSVNIYGVHILITSTRKNIIDFIDNNLCSFRATNSAKKYDLIINIAPIANPYVRFPRIHNMPSYGSELFLTEKKTVYQTQTIHIDTEFTGNTLNVHVQKRLRWRQFARKIIGIKPNDNALQEIYRFGVEYPILALLNNKNTLSTLHAAGVLDADNQAILFFGLNGAGKSTLLDDMTKKGYRAIGENFVLHKEGHAYAFPGVKKLPKIPAAEKHNIVGKTYGKFLIKEKYSVNPEGYPIKRVNVVSRTDGETKVIPLDKPKALWFLNTIGDYLKEYENYHYTAFLESDKASITHLNYDRLSDEAAFYLVERNRKVQLDDSQLL